MEICIPNILPAYNGNLFIFVHKTASYDIQNFQTRFSDASSSWFMSPLPLQYWESGTWWALWSYHRQTRDVRPDEKGQRVWGRSWTATTTTCNVFAKSGINWGWNTFNLTLLNTKLWTILRQMFVSVNGFCDCDNYIWTVERFSFLKKLNGAQIITATFMLCFKTYNCQLILYELLQTFEQIFIQTTRKVLQNHLQIVGILSGH